MKDLESFLNAYRLNLENFDLDVFEDDIMDIPYQIEEIDKYYKSLTDTQKNTFSNLNDLLAKKIETIKPDIKKHTVIKNIISESLSKVMSHHGVAA